MMRVYWPLNLSYRRSAKSNGILGFTGDYRFLSNFYVLDQPFAFNGLKFDCSERCYMWHKSFDKRYQAAILRAPTPRHCKRLGRSAQLRSDWEVVKLKVMLNVLKAKFVYGSELANRLLDTRTLYLEETNSWHDSFWGVCNGAGENHLGRLLMVVRYQLNLQLKS